MFVSYTYKIICYLFIFKLIIFFVYFYKSLTKRTFVVSLSFLESFYFYTGLMYIFINKNLLKVSLFVLQILCCNLLSWTRR